MDLVYRSGLFNAKDGSCYWDSMENTIASDSKLIKYAPLWTRVVFMLSNIPYFMLTYWIFIQSSNIVTCNLLPHSIYILCRSPLFYSSIASMITLSSILMHASQMQLLGCCCTRKHSNQPYDNNDHILHQPAWQQRLRNFDFMCVLSTVVIPGFCQGSTLALQYLVTCIPLFAAGQYSKKNNNVTGYMVWHSIWHICTAWACFLAVSQSLTI